MAVPCLQAIGGALLIWIAVSLINGDNGGPGRGPRARGQEAEWR